MTRLCVLALALLCLLPDAFAATNPHAPNLSLYVYQRIMPPEKTPPFSLSTYNLRSARLAVYRVELETLIPNTALLQNDERQNPNSLAYRIDRIKLSGAARSWSAPVKHFYQNDWREQQVKLPKLAPGVYVLEASGGGVRKRTWFAISRRALLLKRSPDVVQAWLVDAQTGTPLGGVPLALYNATGKVQTVTTKSDGQATFPVNKLKGLLQVAARAGEPAFALSSALEAEKPFVIFLQTDRPVYRPGHLVRFRGTARAVSRGIYSVPKEKEARVQIKARGDTLIFDEKLPLNEWGTFSGEFQLAAEPPLGTYSLEVALPDYREYTSFEVEAYRKPEFEVKATVPAEHYPGGSTVPVTIAANYFFGSPVSGGKVTYRVRFNRTGESVPARVLTAAGLGSAATGTIEEGFTGQGRLGVDGKLLVEIPTRRVPFDRYVTLETEVTDLSLRPRQASVSTTVTAARFRLSLNTKSYYNLVNKPVDINVTAVDYENKPVATEVTVSLIEYLRDREKRLYAKRTDKKVTTDKEGRGTFTVTPSHPGDYQVEAWGRDADGSAVFARTSFTAMEKLPGQEWPTLEMSLNKDSYAPGETALLRVRTSLVGAWALLTVEGDKLYRSDTRQITAKEFTIKLPISADYQPGLRARLSIIQKGRLSETEVDLDVPATDKALQVVLTPNKSTYAPGEKATYDLTVRDNKGRGVATELGMNIVDTALFAIAPDQTPNPFDFFWSWQEERVQASSSLSAAYPGGGYQHVEGHAAYAIAAGIMPKAMPPSPVNVNGAALPDFERPQIRVRRTFADIAYWAPSLTTGPDGSGQVTLNLPDNLTSWRATARGVTKATQAGEARTDVKVTMPLLARLTLPRFYISGDQATAAAVVHNYTGAEREVKVTLSSEGAAVTAPATQTVRIPAGGLQRLTWKVTVAGLTGQGRQDKARFLVSADGGADAADAMESTVPVFPDGVQRVQTAAGMGAESADFKLTVPAEAVPGSAALQVSVSPSLAGPIFSALEYLVDYPHGCAEQTMERFLPNIIVTRALRELGADRPEPPMLKRYVSFGLQKLLRYQHENGGWHWWEFDQSDPYITAYIVYGLAMARDAGYPLAAGPLPRGLDYLRRALQNEQDRNAVAYLLWAMAYSDAWGEKDLPQATARAQKLFAERDKLDIFSQASLVLALDRMSRESDTPKSLASAAATLANELDAVAVITGNAAHWTANAAEGGCGSWLDSDVEVTSQVLLVLLALKPDSPHIVPAVRWLMAARQGKAWNSTKDTAAAVLALTAYLRRAKELAPDATVIARVNGQAVQTTKLGKEQVFSDPIQITVPAAALKPGENAVRLEKTGAGNLYWSAVLSYTLPAEGLTPLAQGITVKRRYRVIAEDPVTAGEQTSGSVVEVTVDLIADQAYRYCALEEPIPAGCEILDADADVQPYYSNDWRRPRPGFDRRENWDDKIVYYFDYLRKGEQTITYWLRTESPGSYRVRPGAAWLMYFPDVRGEGKLVHLKVVEE